MIFQRKLTVAVALASTVAAIPAVAQDVFQGPYISVFAGAAQPQDSSSDSLVFDTNRNGEFNDTVSTAAGANAFGPGFCDGTANAATPAEGCDKDGRDFDYGVRVGFDGRPGGGPFLAGVLAEYQRSQVADSTSAFSTTPANYVVRRELDDAFNVRGRLGFVFGESVLLYGTGGASRARIEHTFTSTNTANSFTQVNDRDRVWGWQGGAGAEVAVTPAFTLGLEYLYSTYDLEDYSVQVGPGTAPATNPFLLVNSAGTDLRPSDKDFNIHALRATANFRF
jgi:outer membrane immunogenic protein